MTSALRLLAGAAALSACLCVSAAGFAQDSHAGMAGPPAVGGHDRWADQMRERAEAKAQALHDILNIRPDQEAAFQALTETMPGSRHEHGGMGMDSDRDEMGAMTMPDRMDRMAAHMADKQTEFQRHADAVKRLYGQLGPEQRRAFDAVGSMMMMSGGAHHGMGGHMGHMGGEGMGGHEGDDD
jgi:hypothetical protein